MRAHAVSIAQAMSLLAITTKAAVTPTSKASCLPPPLSDLLGIDPILPTIIELSPNPIAGQYPGNITGLANGTIAVLPIPYTKARSIIPSQYGILKDAYQELLPGFPSDQYPVVIRSIFEYDIGLAGLELVPDFQQIEIRFPFVDVLGDGYSAFAYEMVDLIDVESAIALLGSAAYGETVYPSTFVPADRAYAYVNNSNPQDGNFLLTYTNVSSCPTVAEKYVPQTTIGPWPFNFYLNYTNQPWFGDAKKGCGQQIAFFNTSISAGANAPFGLLGDVFIAAPFLPENTFFQNVHGVAVNYAWLENNLLPCSSLKGL